MNEVTEASRHLTASAIVTDEFGRVLLVFHKASQLWVFPGGHVEPDETLSEAAHREVLEETGVNGWFTSKSWGLSIPRTIAHPLPIDVREFVAPAKPERPGKPAEPQHHHIDHLFQMAAESSDLKPERTEVEEAGWFYPLTVESLDAREDVPVLLNATQLHR